ncbi:toll-like receptor 9 [Rhinoderma darwinii]|uniref:toll-like receptor 9 n=1 Tax=Rhinoderma darwinii TaxID=43563 RepID=UPI003F67DD3A
MLQGRWRTAQRPLQTEPIFCRAGRSRNNLQKPEIKAELQKKRTEAPTPDTERRTMGQHWFLERSVPWIFGVSMCLGTFPHYAPCNSRKNGTVVSCRGHHLKHLPHISSERVTDFDLSDNDIRRLVNGSFSGVPNLWRLNTSNNCQPLTLRPDMEPCQLTIERDALVNLKQLRTLDLSGNSLTALPPLPDNITYLNINLNRIVTLSDADLAGVTRLRYLLFGWNCYYRNPCDTEVRIPQNVLRDMKTLTGLVLAYNNMSSFPRNLPSSLIHLDLSENRISRIVRDDLCQFRQLLTLDIEWNCQRCDHAVSPCLPCRNNSALQLEPGVFDCIRNLSSLNLKGNSILTINSAIFQGMDNLRSLALSDNHLDLEKETFFSKLPNVEFLDLSYNFDPLLLRARLIINPSMAAMSALRRISLAGYFFNILDYEGIEPLLSLPNIHEVNLKTNFILEANLSMFLYHKKLCYVVLAENLISFHAIGERDERRTQFTAPVRTRHRMPDASWVGAASDDEATDSDEAEDSGGPEYSQCYMYNRSVDLSFNNLMSLHPDSFLGMEEVECLNMSYNFINQRLNGTEFLHLKSLRHLDLSYNRFDLYYYLALSELPNLKVLNLASNNYQFMMDGVYHSLNFLENLPALIQLNLNSNLIGLRMNQELKNPSLERLFFRMNRLHNMWLTGKDAYNTIFTNLTRLKLLDISYNDLKVIPVKALKYLPDSLEYLILSHNQLYSFHWENIVHLGNLTHLDLGFNFLTSLTSNITGSGSKLSFLNLKHNKISSLNKEFFSAYPELQNLFLDYNRIQTIDRDSFPPTLLRTLSHLDVSSNPFDCTCHTSWFIQFLMATNITVENLSTKMMCDSPDTMRGRSLLYMDPQSCQDLYGYSCFVYSMVLVTVLMSVTTFWKLFSWDVWYLSQVIMASLRRYSKLRGDANEEYNAFVAFDTKDNAVKDWVYQELLEHLEGPGLFNLCLEERDWIPGRSSIENLYEAIYQSKRTIFILTREGFRSGLLRHAFLMCHQRLLDEKRDVLVFVILDTRMKTSKYLMTRRRICPQTFLNWPRNPRAHGHFWYSLRMTLRQDRHLCCNPRFRKPLN